MNTLIVRHANKSNIQSLCDLYKQFYKFHTDMLPERVGYFGLPQNTAQIYEHIESILSGDNAIIFVAEKENQIVGCAEVLLVKNIIEEKYGYLSKLIVIESHRRQGIGTLMLKTAQNWVIEKGALEIQIDVWEFSKSPISFYQKRGYDISRYVVVKQFNQHIKPAG